MPWGWGGRGYRWMFWLTGLPGWMRFGYGWPVGPWGWWGWRCRWFPWLPRWWWTGMYGPVYWTPLGPTLGSYPSYYTPPTSYSPYYTPPTSEIEALKEEKRMLEEQLKHINQKIKELSGER